MLTHQLRDLIHQVNFRTGRVSVISATAHKLTVIILNMIIKKAVYLNPETYLFHEYKIKVKSIANIKKKFHKFTLTNEELQFATVYFYKCNICSSQNLRETYYYQKNEIEILLFYWTFFIRTYFTDFVDLYFPNVLCDILERRGRL